MRFVVPDFETRSLCDLKKCGAWRYAEDVTTEILCLSFAMPEGSVISMWGNALFYRPEKAQTPGTLEGMVNDPDVWFVPHNAAFEKAIWRHIMVPVYGWPDIPDKRWDDSLARCANLVIPQGLDEAVRVLRLPALKDNEGSAFTIGLSKPDRKGNLPPCTPEIIKTMVVPYCEDDCRAQLGLRNRVGTLSNAERQVWLLDQRINQRGVHVDMELVGAMQKIVDDTSRPLLKEFGKLTGLITKGKVKLASPKLKDWCHARGVHIPNLQRDTIIEWLKIDDVDNAEYETLAGEIEPQMELDFIPDEVRRALHIKQLIGSASIKKLAAARNSMCADGRIRGMFQYHGAGPGLWAGRLFQPQNIPRGTLTGYEDEDGAEFADRKVAALRTGDHEYVETMVGPPVETVISSLRHIIIPSPGRELVVGDFAGIQARVVLAAAGQHDKTKLMASGADVYIDMACDIFGLDKPDWSKGKEHFKPLVKAFKLQHNEKRQYGKNSILGLGFQMGWRKFLFRYCKGQPEEFAKRIVDTYRKEWAPEVPKLWRELEEAAIDTVHYRRPHEAYGCLFRLEDLWLTCRLPSGRKLYYFNPQPIRKEMPWSTEEEPDVRKAITYQARKMGKWVTIDAFGGQWAENLASALARDLLVAAMFKCEKNGLPLVMTVHDELVADAPVRNDNATVMRQIMEDREQWAIDMQIPVEAECWSSDRCYRK